MIVLSSPSGGGKTTIAQRLLKKDKNLVRSVSCTTRKPRVGERNGRDYYFISTDRFKRMITRKDFLEWAKVHQHLYGTPKAWVDRQLARGRDVLFIIDVQGGRAVQRQTLRQISGRVAKNVMLIFLKPPKFSVLKQRLLKRRSESASALKVRLQNARWEIKQGRRYDYQVVNGRLGKAVSDVTRIIRVERKKKEAGDKR
jgi:guanylate kinase